MAKDKTDYSKLTLGRKKTIKKEEKVSSNVDEIVNKIHDQKVVEVKEDIRTKRITLDIPVPLHKRIRNRAYDLEIPMKKYFLQLAERDLEGEQ